MHGTYLIKHSQVFENRTEIGTILQGGDMELWSDANIKYGLKQQQINIHYRIFHFDIQLS